jgi:hypothetical protein
MRKQITIAIMLLISIVSTAQDIEKFVSNQMQIYPQDS